MIKSVLLLGLLVFLGCTPPAPVGLPPTQDGPKIAIAIKKVRVLLSQPQNMTLRQRVKEQDYEPYVAQALEMGFINTGHYDVVECANVEALKQEIAQDQDDLWFNQTGAPQPGSLRAPQFLAFAVVKLDVGPLGSTATATIKVVNCSTGKGVKVYMGRGTSAGLSISATTQACLERMGDDLTTKLSRNGLY